MNSINVREFVDESKFNRFHGLVVFWCFFILVFDGFDLVVYGTIVPALMEEWSLTGIQAGALGSYALLGMMFGGFIFGPLADKFGRKNIIILCVTIFSLFTGLIAFATNTTQFGLFRFIAGLGLGGMMPNAIALMTEFSPKSSKNTLVSIMLSGYSLGGILSAALGIYLIPKFGWESMFLVGAIPLLTIPIMYKSLPESPGFLVARKKNKQIAKMLSKIDPSFIPSKNDVYEIVVPKQKGTTVSQLFRNGRAINTFMFWIAYFMCLLMMYGLNTWLPKIMTESGYAMGSSLMFLLVLNLGAIGGSILGAWASDRWNAKTVLVLFFFIGAVSLVSLGLQPNIVLLYILIAIAGAGTIGTQILLFSFTSQYYPIHIRSTGIGWSSAVGRFGAISGPMMGGVLLSMNLALYQSFMAFAVAGIIAAFAIMLIQKKRESNVDLENYDSDKQVL
ncbi:MFS transporter [Niallia endozanthoxylica]|uniref:Aromatic acid/H+ symport family MFS transporter n=1 Tax=Niallia endozanthoxylica TaxID=2036016 RepID=A0A5J5HTS6_9BACI|nr:aromatic acid/H+ symport family MFS transporter [Niallia endozanthoxylica]KAA9023797.1 aromatic acid/H+ symport family MFS transporter [Niallia endozanthoxylica]